MARYFEVDDVKEISSANLQLVRRLKSRLEYRKKRTIGFPSNYFDAEVRFASEAKGSMWWHGREAEGKRAFLNYFGHGDPRAGDPLFIDLQFNFPSDTFDRKSGGVFIRDAETDQILLGHRGIVTRGEGEIAESTDFRRGRLVSSLCENFGWRRGRSVRRGAN